jgi:hypothetical protein
MGLARQRIFRRIFIAQSQQSFWTGAAFSGDRRKNPDQFCRRLHDAA